MAKILGIDLGTTFSAMAVIEAGEPKIIENKEGGRTTPSVVALTKSAERLVGVLARRQQITNPKSTVYSIKRLIGRKFSDAEVQKDKKLLPYEIREKKDGGVEVKMGDKWHTPTEISAMILQKLKRDAEAKLGETTVRVTIISLCAYFPLNALGFDSAALAAAGSAVVLDFILKAIKKQKKIVIEEEPAEAKG